MPAFSADFDAGRSVIWYALLYCAGIAFYFSLGSEPSPLFLLSASLFLFFVVVAGYRRGTEYRLLLAALIILAGAGAASLRTETAGAPAIDRPRTATLTGFVESLEKNGGRIRAQIRVADLSGFGRGERPGHVRISYRANETSLRIGDGIRARARLMPPQDAVIPGGYDYAFLMFYDGVGATGYALGRPEPISLGSPPFDLKIAAAIDNFRVKIADRIVSRLGNGREGALAVALLVGDRSLLDDETENALRGAGLAHILAISGLHMALFAGAVFFALRAALALFPRLALRHPIDHWAAFAALLAATFYLVISGASVATQRAYVMMALILVGRILGRRALTYRSVSLAAVFILTATPEALLQPGFQMSFAAVVVLIAAYEEVTRRRALKIRILERNRSIARRIFDRILFGLTALALTSIVAGTATGVIGAYHFQRVAPLGFFVNVVAMPIVTLAVMPFGVLSLAVIPLGLEGLTLPVMGYGLNVMVEISVAASRLTPGEGLIGAQSACGTLLIAAAGLVLCLFPVGYRRLSYVPLALGAAAMALTDPPDLYISADGRNIAFRTESGAFYTTASRLNFESEVWLRAEGIGKTDFRSHQAGNDLQSCDDDACLVQAFSGHGMATSTANRESKPLVVSLIRKPGAFVEDCRRADIIVTPLDFDQSCKRALVVDRQMLRQSGALALKLARSQLSTTIEEIIPSKKVDRPWSARGLQ